MRQLTIAGRRIADDEPAYVIAELGHNHGGSVATACDLIRSCARAGVDAVKLQKRENTTLYSPALLAQPYVNEHSFGATYGEHRAALELNALQYRACRTAAVAAGVTCFATAFDPPSLAFLLGLQVPAIKLASGSVTDVPLLTLAGQSGVPVILSTGGSTDLEIDRAVQILARHTSDVALLHCTAAYPVLDPAELNLRCITTLRERYPQTVIGWSGHDTGIAMALVAYSLGARIIEKHVTLNRASKGTDHAFSLEPQGVRTLCDNLKQAHLALGDGVKRVYRSEAGPIAKMRRTEQDGIWQIRTPQEMRTHV